MTRNRNGIINDVMQVIGSPAEKLDIVEKITGDNEYAVFSNNREDKVLFKDRATLLVKSNDFKNLTRQLDAD